MKTLRDTKFRGKVNASFIDPQEELWYIKHGVKMTAMPALDLIFDDHKIWSLVAFVNKKLPKLSAAQYKQIIAIADSHAGNGDPASAAAAATRRAREASP